MLNNEALQAVIDKLEERSPNEYASFGILLHGMEIGKFIILNVDKRAT